MFFKRVYGCLFRNPVYFFGVFGKAGRAALRDESTVITVAVTWRALLLVTPVCEEGVTDTVLPSRGL